MSNPYHVLPPTNFWKTAVAEVAPNRLFPIPAKRFRIEAGDTIATAGSCFAQEVGKYLAKQQGVTLLVEETAAEGQPLFSARYGNVYTVEQLVQLFDRAHGTFTPVDGVWMRNDGRYVDAFRPYIFRQGFATVDDVMKARHEHLRAVRNVFSRCSIFVFTLGLTESWRTIEDGAVLPVAPGVVTDHIDPDKYEFHNFTYAQVEAGLKEFINRLQSVNARARIIFTVSPVPLIATYTPEHVLVATTYSKSVLRTACTEVSSAFDFAHYFPSYEIISGVYSRGAYYNENLRTVTKDGVDHVMETFRRTYIDVVTDNQAAPEAQASTFAATTPSGVDDSDEMPICDEEEIVRSIGFD